MDFNKGTEATEEADRGETQWEEEKKENNTFNCEAETLVNADSLEHYFDSSITLSFKST